MMLCFGCVAFALTFVGEGCAVVGFVVGPVVGSMVGSVVCVMGVGGGRGAVVVCSVVVVIVSASAARRGGVELMGFIDV